MAQICLRWLIGSKKSLRDHPLAAEIFIVGSEEGSRLSCSYEGGLKLGILRLQFGSHLMAFKRRMVKSGLLFPVATYSLEDAFAYYRIESAK